MSLAYGFLCKVFWQLCQKGGWFRSRREDQLLSGAGDADVKEPAFLLQIRRMALGFQGKGARC